MLEHLYERPIVSVADVRALTGTTYPAANQFVASSSSTACWANSPARSAIGAFATTPTSACSTTRPDDGDRPMNDLKPYPAYKDSGVPWLGEVPAHWEHAAGMRIYRQDRNARSGDIPDTSTILPLGLALGLNGTGGRRSRPLSTDRGITYKRRDVVISSIMP